MFFLVQMNLELRDQIYIKSLLPNCLDTSDMIVYIYNASKIVKFI